MLKGLARCRFLGTQRRGSSCVLGVAAGFFLMVASLFLVAFPAAAQQKAGQQGAAQQAQNPSESAPVDGLRGLKLGVVDFNRALNESKAGEQSKSILNQVQATKRAELDQLSDQIQSVKKGLETTGALLTPSARKAKAEELALLEAQLNQNLRQAQQEYRKRELQLTESVLTELQTIAKVVGQQEGVDLVLEKNAYDALVLYSVNRPLDLTAKVISAYNAIGQ